LFKIQFKVSQSDQTFYCKVIDETACYALLVAVEAAAVRILLEECYGILGVLGIELRADAPVFRSGSKARHR
jgi:hypothetical protein